MKLYMSDMYRVESHYPLDDVQNDSLYYLYQPLIGAQSLQFYMMLTVEAKRMSHDSKSSSLSRLVSFLSISLIDIEKACRTLEAIGLLKTFVKYENDMTYYLYQLQSPLSIKAFFKNQILFSLFQESLSKEDFDRTVDYFKISIEDTSSYEDVTAHFQDVFTIQHLKKNGKLLHYQEDFPQQSKQELEISYDMELLYRGLADYQISRAKLSKDDLVFATQLAHVYSIEPLTLAGLIKDSMDSRCLNHNLLKTNIKKYYDIDHMSKLTEVYHKQPLQYHTKQAEQSPLVLHMKYLDSMTPYELLKEKQGGKEPVFHDLKIVETLMVQLGLKPAVVNVLIEYVLAKHDNRLSKSYCETIGASWARKNIQTAMEAYDELMNERKTSQTEVELKHENSSTPELNQQEIQQLLAQLKEG